MKLFARRRRGNHRVDIGRGSLVFRIGSAVGAAARRMALVPILALLGKSLIAIIFLAGAAWGGERAVRHVIASPRFALREVRVSPTAHVLAGDVVTLAGVNVGDRLLSIDTDEVAARVISHPWIATARVRRELPGALAIDVVERRQAAVASLGGFYLLDTHGRPFKRATADEADGLPVITGVTREQFSALRPAAEAAFREALAVAALYRAHPGRPALSEINIDPSFGFSLFFLDGGTEVRLGRGDHQAKLERLDAVLAALGPDALPTLQIAHLDQPAQPDGAARQRVAVRFASALPTPKD